MTRCGFNGHEALTFPDYLDLGTGKTLAAVPGGSYDVAPASGRNVPDVPSGWFTPLSQQVGVGALPEGDSAPPEPDGGDSGLLPVRDEDPETEVPREF